MTVDDEGNITGVGNAMAGETLSPHKELSSPAFSLKPFQERHSGWVGIYCSQCKKDIIVLKWNGVVPISVIEVVDNHMKGHK